MKKQIKIHYDQSSISHWNHRFLVTLSKNAYNAYSYILVNTEHNNITVTNFLTAPVSSLRDEILPLSKLGGKKAINVSSHMYNTL